MTLHTRVATLAPFELAEFHEWFNRECLNVDHSQVKITHEEDTDFDRAHFDATMGQEKNRDGSPCGERRWIPNGTWRLGNELGQGFDAWFWMEYRPDGWLHPTPQYTDENYDYTYDKSKARRPEDDEGNPIGGEPKEASPAMCVEINFDTAYGHRPGELNCSQLHTLYIAKIGAWMDERGVDWSWYNEFTGEWHHRYDELETFADDGQGAMDWFRNVVQPVINEKVATTGGTIHWEGS